jgi:hypothetical protein
MPDVERASERTPLIHNRAATEQEVVEANSSAFFSGIGMSRLSITCIM